MVVVTMWISVWISVLFDPFSLTEVYFRKCTYVHLVDYLPSSTPNFDHLCQYDTQKLYVMNHLSLSFLRSSRFTNITRSPLRNLLILILFNSLIKSVMSPVQLLGR